MRESDIVGDILDRVTTAIRAHLSASGADSSLTTGLCKTIAGTEHPIRTQWGGETVYVPKHVPDYEARRQAIEEARRTGRVRAAAERHGVPRCTLYRLLKVADTKP